MLTKTQIAKLIKSKRQGKGSDIKISKSQIRKAVVEGGSLWSSLFSLGTRMLPYAGRAVSKVAPALATGALSALGSLGIDKIFGKGQTGGFLVPQSKIDQLIKHKGLLTKKQKEDIVAALQSGSGQVVIKPTPTQSGGFLGTLLASIGVPLLLNALTGKGLHVEGKRPRRSIPVFVPSHEQHTTGYSTQTPKKKGGKHLMMPWQPPPFIGSWDNNMIGLGVKKNNPKGKGLLLGKNSPFNSIPILGSIL